MRSSTKKSLINLIFNKRARKTKLQPICHQTQEQIVKVYMTKVELFAFFVQFHALLHLIFSYFLRYHQACWSVTMPSQTLTQGTSSIRMYCFEEFNLNENLALFFSLRSWVDLISTFVFPALKLRTIILLLSSYSKYDPTLQHRLHTVYYKLDIKVIDG